MSVKKDLETKLINAMLDEGDIPQWENYPKPSNYKFNRPTNSMELDFAWPELKVAVEVNGSQWVQNTGHNSGTGVERDARKGNYAALQGWIYLVFVTDHIDKRMSKYTIPTLREALRLGGAELLNYDEEISKLFNEEQKELT